MLLTKYEIHEQINEVCKSCTNIIMSYFICFIKQSVQYRDTKTLSSFDEYYSRSFAQGVKPNNLNNRISLIHLIDVSPRQKNIVVRQDAC